LPQRLLNVDDRKEVRNRQRRSAMMLFSAGGTHEAIMNRCRRTATALVILILALVTTQHAVHGQQPAAPKDKAADCQRSAFRIVVDVGHTVAVPGADSARGVPEYTFNLQLADAAKQALVEAGFDQTVRLITTTAPWRGLVERAARANATHANLFISIHHDSVPDNLIEPWEYEGQKHQFSDRFKGYSIFISNGNGDRKGSLAFAHLLGEALQARGLHYTPHYTLPLMGRHRHELVDAEAGVYRNDQLIVLRDTHMPAVLLEAGSIVNRQEELEMATPERRAVIAAAITSAVEDFCTARAQPNTEAPIKQPTPSGLAPPHAKPAALAR
jgi:N-acetylmuramoyl-L-alanine amidase